MSTARDLAIELGLKTADQVGPPEALPARAPIRWTLRRRYIFKALAPEAFSVVGTEGPISGVHYAPDGHVLSTYGGNRGVWPVRLVKGRVWRDHATTVWDKSPTTPMRTQARVWAMTGHERDALLAAAGDHLGLLAAADGGADLLHGFVDLGPQLSFGVLERDLCALGVALGVPTWNDAGMVRWFDSLGERADAACAERCAKWSTKLIERLARADLDKMTGRG